MGQSNRIVVLIDEHLKKRLYSALALKGITLKAWFTEEVRVYLDEQGQGRLQFANKDDE